MKQQQSKNALAIDNEKAVLKTYTVTQVTFTEICNILSSMFIISLAHWSQHKTGQDRPSLLP